MINILWAEMVMGRNGYGPKWSWPKWLWVEMTRNPSWQCRGIVVVLIAYPKWPRKFAFTCGI